MEYEIRPAGKFKINFSELWDFRELIYFFTWRDIKVKYKQTVLGAAWVILQPLLLVVIFSYTFSRLLSMETGTLQYPLFVFSGLLLWNIFSNGINSAGNSMISNSNIINKIYFPRLIIPISSIFSTLVDFAIQFGLFLVTLLIYGKYSSIGPFILVLPISLTITLLTTFGMGSFLAALNVKYRDFRYIVPFMTQVLLFLTPIIYPVSSINVPLLRMVFILNPVATAIELLRNGITGTPPHWDLVLLAFALSAAIFLVGITYFRKTEQYFADLA